MKPAVFGIGEALWDLFPSGRQLGGAPANFAFHAAALGVDAGVVTRVGSDFDGEEVKSKFAEMGLSTALVQSDPSLPTGTVSVTLSGAGIPEYTIHEPAAWDRLSPAREALDAMRGAAAVCFGSLAQRNAAARQSIQQLVAATPAGALRIFDVNLRQRYYDRATLESSLALANVVKLNEDEVPVVSDLIGVEGTLKQRIERMAARFDLRVAAVTRGEAGASLLFDGRWSDQPARRVEVLDTVGAGDAFTAAICIGLLRGLDLDAINQVANDVAAFVCGSRGATPSLPQGFRSRLV